MMYWFGRFILVVAVLMCFYSGLQVILTEHAVGNVLYYRTHTSQADLDQHVKESEKSAWLWKFLYSIP